MADTWELKGSTVVRDAAGSVLNVLGSISDNLDTNQAAALARSKENFEKNANRAKNGFQDTSDADSPKNRGGWIYPPNLNELDHWMAIRIGDFKFRRDADILIQDTLGSIYLPIPRDLQTTYSQEWADENLPLGLGAALEDYHENGDFSGALSKAGNNALNSLPYNEWAMGLAAGGLGGALIGNNIAGALIGGSGAVIAKGLQLANKKALNTFESVSYNKPKLRTHRFAWELVARSSSEADTIRQIIFILKVNSSPSIEEGGLLEYPKMFDIDFKHSATLFNIGPSVLESMTINYHRGGRPIYAIDDASQKSPVHVEISAEFKEIAAVTQETIREQNR